jgi:ABC-type amino acid transport substrate-binding protein
VKLYSILSFLLLLMFTSCGKKNDDKDILIIGVAADNAPYEYIEQDQIVGFDIDVIREITKKMGKTILIKNVSFPMLLSSLSNKSIDIAISAITPTAERKKHIDFSDIYYDTSLSVLFREGTNIKDTAHLSNKTIGVQKGTIWHNYIDELCAQNPNMKIKILNNNLALIEELKVGNIDAIVMEEQQAHNVASMSSGINEISLDHDTIAFAIAVDKDSALKSGINKAIRELKKNGEIQKIATRWLKFE